MQIYQAGVKPILAPTGKKKKEGKNEVVKEEELAMSFGLENHSMFQARSSHILLGQEDFRNASSHYVYIKYRCCSRHSAREE